LIALDLIGLLIIGAIVAIATSAVQGTELPSLVETASNLLNLGRFSPQESAALLGLTAGSLLIFKSLLSYYFGLRNFAFLARREAAISEGLARQIFSLQITDLQKYSTPQYQHALTIGSSSVMVGVLGQSLSLVTELALQFSMLITLFFFSPILTLLCLCFFSILFFTLNKVQGGKARTWGLGMTHADVSSTSLIADAIGSYREIVVSGRRSFFIDNIKRSRQEAARFQVNKSMLTQFSKYTFEISVVIAGLGISAYAFLTKPALQAASLVAIFFTAAYRIAPSVLKLQQGVLQLKGAAGATELFFEIQDHVNRCLIGSAKTSAENIQTLESHLKTAVYLKDVTFTYSGRVTHALNSINLNIPANQTLAIVGPSGAGKSTLVDVILGVIKPSLGKVEVYGHDPILLQNESKKEISIGYVPQSVYLSNGTILENICIGIEELEIDLERAWRSLSAVLLDDWVSKLDDGIYTLVGERGSQLSGGQKQRLGIARALYLDPKILVLDEATSSLDAESEHEISKTIQGLKDKVTVIVIAHRLSTVINADQVIYMQDGSIVAQGTFDSLRDLVPNFDRQANLMGIKR